MTKLLVKNAFGGSLDEINVRQNEREEKGEKALGLLRRAFSSRKRKSTKQKKPSAPSSGQYLAVPNAHHRQPSPSSPTKQRLRPVRSSPTPGSRSPDGSPSSDLTARRGVFSRKHYGSVEFLVSGSDSDGSAQSAGRFRVETGERDVEEVSSPLHSPVHLENPEFQTRWYFKFFLGKLHQNYVGCDSEKEPFFLSVVVTDANNHNVPQYRAILWRKTGTKKICLSYTPNKPMTVKAILSHFDLDKVERGPREIFNPDIQKDLLLLEEQEGAVTFKFGILYAKDGQISDDEMYSNEIGSEEFKRFYKMLGDEVKLKGWDKYRGGLDTKSDTTGLESIYTVYEGHEVMFHISTMLPYSEDNKQQVERKRHIGNDIVNIIFVEGEDNKIPNFKPSMMKTHFTHIYAVVSYIKETDGYRLNVFSAESVPLFGPPLLTPPIFHSPEQFRNFLLVKLINGEKAAFNVPVFAQKRQRTLDMLIRNLYQEHVPENAKSTMLNRRAFSDLIPENVSGSRRKEEARQLEFLRVGQSLKVKTILRGEAPTSLISSGALLKQEPWAPQCFLQDFQYDVISGDSWGDKLIVATSTGTFVLEEGAVPRMVFDKSVAIKQLNVVEAHGLLVFMADKGKDCRVYVFRLTDFEGEEHEELVRTKNDCKDHKLDKTKGCHMYAISRPCGSHLRVVVAVGKRLMVLMWKHSSAWSAWCPSSENEVVDGFQFLRELQSFDTPQLMTLIDGPKGDNHICVGYKNQFDLINDKNGDTLQLYQVDSSKVNLISALDIYEDDEPELLLCYNHISHFQKLREDLSHEFDFSWNTEPEAVVCAFPYILAFTSDTIEVRLIINGSLVHTMTMPNVQIITSKCDIYFASSAPTFCNASPTCPFKQHIPDPSPPPSPSSKTMPSNIYKIPLTCLVGQIASDKTIASTAPAPHSMLSPLVNVENAASAKTGPRRSPLLRTSRLGPSYLPNEDVTRRHDSNSSSTDSGYLGSARASRSSPPVSPFYLSMSTDDESAIV